jgi:hypothetical protein
MPSTMYAWVTEPPYAWRSRFSIRSTAMNVISIPIHSRPIRRASDAVDAIDSVRARLVSESRDTQT